MHQGSHSPISKSHTGEKPFKCNKNDKVYVMTHSLIQYQNSNKKQKLYKCTECARHLIKWVKFKNTSAKVL